MKCQKQEDVYQLLDSKTIDPLSKYQGVYLIVDKESMNGKLVS